MGSKTHRGGRGKGRAKNKKPSTTTTLGVEPQKADTKTLNLDNAAHDGVNGLPSPYIETTKQTNAESVELETKEKSARHDSKAGDTAETDESILGTAEKHDVTDQEPAVDGRPIRDIVKDNIPDAREASIESAKRDLKQKISELWKVPLERALTLEDVNRGDWDAIRKERRSVRSNKEGKKPVVSSSPELRTKSAPSDDKDTDSKARGRSPPNFRIWAAHPALEERPKEGECSSFWTWRQLSNHTSIGSKLPRPPSPARTRESSSLEYHDAPPVAGPSRSARSSVNTKRTSPPRPARPAEEDILGDSDSLSTPNFTVPNWPDTLSPSNRSLELSPYTAYPATKGKTNPNPTTHDGQSSQDSITPLVAVQNPQYSAIAPTITTPYQAAPSFNQSLDAIVRAPTPDLAATLRIGGNSIRTSASTNRSQVMSQGQEKRHKEEMKYETLYEVAERRNANNKCEGKWNSSEKSAMTTTVTAVPAVGDQSGGLVARMATWWGGCIHLGGS